MTQTLERATTRSRARTSLIDCDVHTSMPSDATLRHYLPPSWRRYQELTGGCGYHGRGYPKNTPAAARTDAWPPSGPPGSDLSFLRRQLLYAWDIEYAILNPGGNPGSERNLEYGAAVARATNDWTAERWLDEEPRLRGSLLVQYEDGDLGAAEIHRLAGDRRFVQVYFMVRTHQPLGNRKYWKVYEAAVRHGLPIGVHFGGHGGNAITGAGWPTYYIEDHAGMAQTFQAQVTSLVCEGVFERFPDLRVVLIEGGVAWLPSLAWRLDRAWELLREEVPQLRRPPSEYIREHFWVTTQPIEEPHRPEDFRELLGQFPLADKLMFSTDYPHWDFDAPDQALRKLGLPDGVERRIMSDNARAFYGL